MKDIYVFLVKNESREELINRLSGFDFSEVNPTELTFLEKNVFQRSIDDQVVELLLELGIKPHLSGFHYLKEAIIYLLNNERKVGITTELYPTVATKYLTTSTRVERCMRHSIQCAWESGRLSLDFTEKPVNSEFLATLVEELKKSN